MRTIAPFLVFVIAALAVAPSGASAQPLFSPQKFAELAPQVHFNREDAALCAESNLLQRDLGGCAAHELQELCAALRQHPTQPPPVTCARVVLRFVRACRERATPASDRDARDAICRELMATPETNLRAFRATSDSIAVSDSGARDLIGEGELIPGAVGGGAAADATASVILGVTSFFVDRAKAEALVFLQDQVARDLCDPERNQGARDFAALLSNTCAVLRGAPSRDAGSALGALPQAFRDDLDAMPWRLLDLVLHRAGVRHQAELRALARVGGVVVADVRNAGVLRALEHFAADDGVTDAEVMKLRARVRAALDFLKAAQPHVAREGERAFGELQVDGVLQDLLALGTPHAQAELDWVSDHRGLLMNLLASMERLRTGRGDASREAARALHENLYAVLIVAIPEGAAWREDAGRMFEAYRDFAARKYVAGVAKLVSLRWVQDALTGMPDGAAKTVLTNITRHIALAAALAEAERPEDVQAALEAAAAPLRSYRVFRRRPFAMFVSGWLGAFSGYETPIEDANRQSGAFIAPSLLVGVELGGRITENHGWSWNVMVSVFDLGAPASVRLGGVSPGRSGESGEARQTPELTFESVFAPGVHVGVGIADTPLVLAAGVQLAPAARQYFVCPTASRGAACEGTETVSTLRFDVGLAMDLPVLPIW